MSFNDIKDGYTEIVIEGKTYKVAYDFYAIQRLEELYETSCFNLGVVIEEIRNKPVEDIINYCFVGFLRHQPDFDIEILRNYPSVIHLFDICTTEYMRTIQMPDAFNELVHQGQKAEVKKKKSLSKLIGTTIKRW